LPFPVRPPFEHRIVEQGVGARALVVDVRTAALPVGMAVGVLPNYLQAAAGELLAARAGVLPEARDWRTAVEIHLPERQARGVGGLIAEVPALLLTGVPHLALQLRGREPGDELDDEALRLQGPLALHRVAAVDRNRGARHEVR